MTHQWVSGWCISYETTAASRIKQSKVVLLREASKARLPRTVALIVARVVPIIGSNHDELPGKVAGATHERMF
jgi:hypothetical protein